MSSSTSWPTWWASPRSSSPGREAGRTGRTRRPWPTRPSPPPSARAAPPSRARGPCWQDQEALAHTLVYDTIVMGGYSLPVERATAVEAPTLALAGGESFPFTPAAARKLAEAMPDARARLLEGQTHAVDPAVL